ncbi:galactonate dehydratase [Polymorphobacter fuscus]|uniref:Galactonate dehydratase n=1 Tax=Sandarakinorhabdus fusca TaxID=1439888 RepID=A0A7C9GWD7_9SPHN|nr:galactonate dehydratase [Polymorphobacter fuscus]KAB7644876.1 galactonate dehydratase [Polymorphobacter fuscus]MQT18158.1 galactonate dehydratase [Polymorphobacter fuscus]NJC09476.1 galactonate dehydratase [Polymorphobacter fuscus]
MHRISTIETFIVPPRWLFVRIGTDEGAVGWGEASLEGHAEAVVGAMEAVRDRIIGHDVRRIEDIWQLLHRLGFYRGGPVLLSAISGIDQALWDIKGRMLGVPVSDLLGGRVRDRMRVYAWIGGDRPSDVADAARRRREQGFDAVKMNGTEDMDWLDSPAAVDAAAERLALVRETGVDVGIDFHGRVHKPMARQLVRALEPLRPLFVEEVLTSEQPEAIAQLAAQTVLPIALGERLYSRWDFKPFFEAASIDVAQPDLSHAGGISECRRIAAMAEAYDVALAPHCPLGPLALAACLQVAASSPNFVIQEMSLGIHYNQADADLLSYVRNPEVLSVSAGMVAVLEGAGLGVEIDEDAVRAAAIKPHRWRNPVWRGRDGALREW